MPGEELIAVFGAWFPRTTKQPVPTRYRHVLVITDRRILFVKNASAEGAVRSVAAGTPALERASAGLAAVASKVAGPSYWWVGEAWQAELEVGPVGVDTPMSAVGKLRYALGLLLVTAPRLRMKTMPDRTRLLWLRVLFSNPAVGTIVGGMLAWATIVFRAESGSAAAATFLTTAIPSAAWGVRWLRAHSTPPRRKGPRADG